MFGVSAELSDAQRGEGCPQQTLGATWSVTMFPIITESWC